MRPVRTILYVVALLAAVIASAFPAGAATSGTVVGATVPSATDLVATACATGIAGRTDLGSLLPGSSVTSSTDCSVVFGSSNDTARLRMFQLDHAGSAMFQSTAGTPDASFSGNGMETDPVAGADEDGQGVAVQDDGAFVVVGKRGPTGFADFQAVRYTTTGILDGGFGTSGRTTIDVGTGGNDEALAVAMQDDQKIVVVGAPGAATFGLVRLLANGTPDPSFGTAGIVRTTIAAGNGIAYGVTVLEDGRILVAGDTVNAGGNRDFAAARYLANGALDPTFGTGGVVTFPIVGGANDMGRGMAVQADGKLVIVGWTDTAGTKDVALARLTTTGALDPTFGGGAGFITYNTLDGDDRAYEVAVQDNGRIVISGTGAGTNYMVARFLSGGGIDSSFAGTGVLTTNVGADGSGVAEGLFLLGDGRIFVGGYSGNGTNQDFSAIRLTAAGALDTTFDGDGRRLWPMGAGTDQAFDIVSGIDGSVVLVGAVTVGATTDLGILKLQGLGMPNYAAGSDWATPGAGFFGVCPRQIINAAGAGGWTADGDADCADGDSDPWKAIPANRGSTGSTIGVTTAAGSATANLRFGLRVTNSQSPGAYLAPVVFELIAPS